VLQERRTSKEKNRDKIEGMMARVYRMWKNQELQEVECFRLELV
jgi:hypothetical protein